MTSEPVTAKTLPCEVCVYADEHGSWPPDHNGTHCEGCHRSWSSKSQSHCMVCHRHFGSNDAGDSHRVKGECRTPEGFPVWQTPLGEVIGGKDPAELADRLRRSTRKGAE